MWSIGESNPVSLRSVSFAIVVRYSLALHTDSFAQQASASLHPPQAALGSAPLQCFALYSAGGSTSLVQHEKGPSMKDDLFHVEHRGVEPLASTMRM